MDRFPQFPPHDSTRDADRPISEVAETLAWAGIGVSVWVLALLAVGYWTAGAAPSFGAYMHGVLLGILLGMVIILSIVTRKPQRQNTRRADGIDRTTRGPGAHP